MMIQLNILKTHNIFIKTSIRYLSQNILPDRNKIIYSKLKPYLDFDEKLENIEELEKSIKLRGLDIKLTSLTSLWKHYQNVGRDIIKLEKEKIKIAENLSKIIDTADAEKIKSLKFSGINIREDLKKLSIVHDQLKEQIYPRVLQLPNDIIDKSNELLYNNIDEEEFSGAEDHLEVGKRTAVLEYISPWSYFLKGQAAIFELGISKEVVQLFLDKKFVLLSNPDCTRNSIVKYLQLEDVQSMLSLEKRFDDENVDQLHLHGGVSVLPFCCFHAKTITDFKDLPVCYVTKGRHYARSQQFEQSYGLYGAVQNTAVQVFIGCAEKSVEDQLNNAIRLLTDYYESLDVPLRIIFSPPEALAISEKLRISFQTYSFVYKQYFEIGNLSLYGDYISKRLRIYCGDKQQNKFMQIISGTVLKIPPLLASVLEQKHDCTVESFFNKDLI